MKKAAVFRLYPTAEQEHYLAGLFGAVRFCYNKGLELKIHYYKVKGVNLHPHSRHQEAPAHRQEEPKVWLVGRLRQHRLTGVRSKLAHGFFPLLQEGRGISAFQVSPCGTVELSLHRDFRWR